MLRLSRAVATDNFIPEMFNARLHTRRKVAERRWVGSCRSQGSNRQNSRIERILRRRSGLWNWRISGGGTGGFSTGFGNSELTYELFNEGVLGILPKPYSMVRLADKVRTVLTN